MLPITGGKRKLCDSCRESYVPDEGELAAVDLLEFGPRRRSTEEIFAAAVQGGMTTMRQDGIRLALAGITSLAEVRRITGERTT